MNSTLIVIDSPEQWAPYFRSESVVTADEYLQDDQYSKSHFSVINLCSNLSYLSEGYYCSLLGQARKHKVLPSIETLNQLEGITLLKMNQSLQRHCNCRHNLDKASGNGGYQLDLFFGKCEDVSLQKLARAVFDQYPAPLLRITISETHPFQVTGIQTLTLNDLNDQQQDLFADSLDGFNKKVWRKPRNRKPARYDLAIFHNPEEQFPPSNNKALKLFISEARKMEIHAELITEADSGRLMEFDALFIRATTAVDDITYKLAQAAEQADMVVIDDPSSIIRCTNKVYLKEFLDTTSIPAPRAKLIFSRKPLPYEQLAEELGKTMVLKIPDGSFSVGIDKVDSASLYREKIDRLFQRSSVLLAQEFIPTDFDWRIGVLNGEAIYACKYYMARGHWQIYRHTEKGNTRSGKFETVPIHLTPRRIVKMAERVANSIGKGLYGVDLKESEKGMMVIEVNDNPSIDHGVEDAILGTELYRIILREFVTRLDLKRTK